MSQYQRLGLPIGHLSPRLDGPACGATGKIRIHRPGITRMCSDCACLLEEPTSGAIITREVTTREFLDAWIAWATGHGGPRPEYREFLPSKPERRDLNPKLNATLPSAIVTFRRA